MMLMIKLIKKLYDNSLGQKLFEVPSNSVEKILQLDNHFLNINV